MPGDLAGLTANSQLLRSRSSTLRGGISRHPPPISSLGGKSSASECGVCVVGLNKRVTSHPPHQPSDLPVAAPTLQNCSRQALARRARQPPATVFFVIKDVSAWSRTLALGRGDCCGRPGPGSASGQRRSRCAHEEQGPVINSAAAVDQPSSRFCSSMVRSVVIPLHWSVVC